jgi:hypothetical protein
VYAASCLIESTLIAFAVGSLFRSRGQPSIFIVIVIIRPVHCRHTNELHQQIPLAFPISSQEVSHEADENPDHHSLGSHMVGCHDGKKYDDIIDGAPGRQVFAAIAT